MKPRENFNLKEGNVQVQNPKFLKDSISIFISILSGWLDHDYNI